MQKSNQKASLREQILHQNIWKLMFKMATPGILGMLVVSINNFVDALFVGQLIGQNALAAISLVLPITMIPAALSAMIGVGSASVLSRAIGSQDVETQQKVFSNLLGMSLVFSAILTVLGYIYASPLIAFMGGKGEVLVYGTSYLEIFMLGSFFRVFAIATNMLIRAEGKVNIAMKYAAISMVINMVLDPLFITGFGWGIEGASLATVSSLGVYTVLNYLYFVKGKNSFPVDLKKVTLDRSILPKVLGVGVAAMMMQLMFLVQQTFVFKSIAYYGNDNDIAFMGACYRVLMLAIVPVFGLVQAMQPIVGINYGAKDFQRVKQTVKVFVTGGMVLLTAIWLPVQLFPTTILHWLLPDMRFTVTDINNFRVAMIMMPAIPLVFIVGNFLQSIGNGLLSGIITVARQVVFFIPTVLILPTYVGISGVYLSAPLVDVVVISLVLVLLSLEFKKLDRKEVQYQSQIPTHPASATSPQPILG
ncbi:MATE family efflux transporter [Microscilla marina]|uniref:Multidrug export protein MepA n=1 Tax=Microscilla marina ATCC 23134 TaxID=313606 RepID=A1ZE11_MICM2|nr:MATE family efflux transporter [Microscilla marina]EAY31319.1 mate efflux family protein [Microscilla marina ATCC 23134]